MENNNIVEIENKLLSCILNHKRDIKQFNSLIMELKTFKSGFKPFYFVNLLKEAGSDYNNLNIKKVNYYLMNSNLLKPIYKGFILNKVYLNENSEKFNLTISNINHLNNIEYFNII